MIELIITGLIGLIVFYFLVYIVMAQHDKLNEEWRRIEKRWPKGK
jgi:Tfp pilus assembly protein PilW